MFITVNRVVSYFICLCTVYHGEILNEFVKFFCLFFHVIVSQFFTYSVL